MIVEVLQVTFENPRPHWCWYTDVVSLYTTDTDLVLERPDFLPPWRLFRDQIIGVTVA